jgi:hypothetical protein
MHGKSRALIPVAPAKAQFAADLPDKGLNNFHSQPLAVGRIISLS